MPDLPNKIKWHPAFYGAAELELQENINELEIIPELCTVLDNAIAFLSISQRQLLLCYPLKDPSSKLEILYTLMSSYNSLHEAFIRISTGYHQCLSPSSSMTFIECLLYVGHQVSTRYMLSYFESK